MKRWSGCLSYAILAAAVPVLAACSPSGSTLATITPTAQEIIVSPPPATATLGLPETETPARAVASPVPPAVTLGLPETETPAKVVSSPVPAYATLGPLGTETPAKAISSPPPSCAEADLVYSPSMQRMLLVNCFSQPASESKPNTIWSWDGVAWTREDDHGPEGQVVTSAAYDAQRDSLVQYGGQPLTSLNCTRETWEWDRRTWTKVDTSSPTACDHFKMLYDSDRQLVLLFGGQDEVMRPVAETWSFNGDAWQEDEVSGPESRAHFGFVYDPLHKQALLYGGLGYAGSLLGDFWLLRDGKWQQVNLTDPGMRSHFGMAFDEDPGVLVIFGGATNSSTYSSLNSDTWALDNGAWSLVSQTGPSPRGSPAMGYDPERDRIVLYGGFAPDQQELSDTWEWDGKAWTCLANCN